MKLRMIAAALLMTLVPFFADAQGKSNGKGKGHNKSKAQKNASKQYKSSTTNVYYGNKKGGPPPWAPAHGYRAKQHVYFPDYRTFYDPYRGGYVYWGNNAWRFSPTAPAYLGGVDLGAARMQLLNDIPLTTHPEVNYSRYATMYPAASVNINIPIPRP